MLERNTCIRLGTIHIGRELARKGGTTVTLSNPALVEFLRKDTNDVAAFGLISPKPEAAPIEVAARHHPQLAPPVLRITLR